ncbi:hypothetical protein ACTQKJ_01270 [Eggerthellaceae bacterium PR-HUZ602407-17]|jgi:hypothetical protein
MKTIRKNITLPEQIYKTISIYAQKRGVSFSEFLRESALEKISKNEDSSLLEYLNKNCDYVDDNEQEEIKSLKLNFADGSGKELSLNELLQG